MSELKPRSIEPFVEQVFKVVERTVLIGIVAFAAAHLEGPAEMVGAVVVAILLFLTALALMEPMLERAMQREGNVARRLSRGAAFLILALGATFIFMFGFYAVLPISG